MKAYTIRKPVITEKSLDLANKNNTFTFLVDRVATKQQIKAAVEHFFGVDVVRIRTILTAADTKRTGRRRLSAKSAKEKKALVTLKEGQTIDLFDIGGQE